MKKKILYTSFFLSIILLLISIIYRESNSSCLKNFPLLPKTKKHEEIIYFHLYVFFQSNNCSLCLDTIKELNDLPEHFKIIGVIPDKEYTDESILKTIRTQIGFKYDLAKLSDFKKFRPNYTPTIIGCSQKGKVFFVFPCVPKSKYFLKTFITSFYDRSFTLLIEEAMLK